MYRFHQCVFLFFEECPAVGVFFWRKKSGREARAQVRVCMGGGVNINIAKEGFEGWWEAMGVVGEGFARREGA